MAVAFVNSYTVVTTSGSTSLTTASFSPAVGELLVVKFVGENNDIVPGTPTSSTGGVTWTLRASDTTSGKTAIYIWTGEVTASGARTITVPITNGAGLNNWSQTTERWTGAAVKTPPATADAQGSGAPSTTITTTEANSYVSWANGDWSAQSITGRAYRSSAVESGVHGSGAYGAYYAYQSAVSAGSQTLGLTAPGSQNWNLVGIELVDSSIPIISFRAAGTATGATAAVTAVNPSVPTGTTTGDLSVLTVAVKPYSATITTPSGWTKIGEATNGTTASGADVGSTKVAVYVRVSATPGAIGNIAQSGADSMGAVIHSYAVSGGGGWDYSSWTSGGDTTNGANYSATGAAGLNVAAGDWVFVGTAVNSDAGTGTAEAIGGMTGATLATHNARTEADVTTGNDITLKAGDRAVASGSSNVAPNYTYTNASSQSGTSLWLRLRPTSGLLQYSGTLDLSGTGAIAPSGSPAPSSTLNLTGSRTLDLSGVGGTMTDTIVYKGSGSTFASASGTTSAVAYPASIAVGDLLVIYVSSNLNRVYSAAGWTALSSGTTATNNQTWILYKIADGSESGTVTVSMDSTATGRRMKMANFSGVDPVNPLDGTPTVRSSTNTAGPYTMASQTPTMAGTMPTWAVTVNDATSASFTAEPTTGNTEIVDGFLSKAGAAYVDNAPLADTSATGVRGATSTVAAANSGVFILLRPNVVNTGPANYSGSLNLAGSRTLDVPGSPSIPGTLADSGTGVLNFAGVPTMGGTLALTGSRTLGLAGAPSWTGTLGLSGSGSTANGTATPAIPAALTLSGSRTLGLAAAVSIGATLSITGGRTLNLAGSPSWTDTLLLSRTGSLQVSGSPTTPGTLALSGAGSLITVGIPTHAGTLALSQSGSMNLSGAPNLSATLSVSGTGGVAGQGTPAPVSTVTINGSRTLATSAAVAIPGTLTLSGSRLLDLAGSTAGAGTLNLTGSRTLGFNGTPTWTVTLGLSGSRTLAQAGAPAFSDTVNLFGVRSLGQAGSPSVNSTLGLSGTGNDGYGASPSTTGTLPLSQSSTLDTAGAPNLAESLALDLSRALDFSGSRDGAGELLLSGSGDLDFAGTASIPSTLWLAAFHDLDADGSPSTGDGLGLAGSTTLGLSGNLAVSGALGLSGSGGTGQQGNPAIPGTTALSGTGLLNLLATALSMASTMNLTGDRVLVLSGVASAEGQGSLNLSGSRVLGFTGTPAIPGTLARSGTGVLEVEGTQANAGTLLLEGTRTLTLDAAPAVAGTLALTSAGEFTFDGVVLANGSLLITRSRTLTLSGQIVGEDTGGMFLKDGTQLHAFMLVGGILIPVTPNFGE